VPRVLLVVLAGDAQKSPDGSTRCGDRTKETCDYAIEVVRKFHNRGQLVDLITCAGTPKPKYGRGMLGWAMKLYLESHPAYYVEVKHAETQNFTTRGEMVRALECIRERAMRGTVYDHVAFVCEDWRQLRVGMIGTFLIPRERLFRRWTIETYSPEESWMERLYWWGYEYASRLWNRYRLTARHPMTA
jgi:hypothetical protein